MLSASELASRVTIEAPASANVDGEVVETWAVVQAGVPAQVIARDSLTLRQAAQVQAQTTHLVTLRYRGDVTSRCRLRIGERTLNILGPPRRVPETRPEAVVMECVEVEAGQ